jgi:hypothetical protein
MEWIDEVKLSPTPSPELDEECQNMHIDEEAEKCTTEARGRRFDLVYCHTQF